MRSKKILITSFLILMLLPWGMVRGEELVFDAWLGFEVDTLAYPWTSITFYSNYTNLFYAIFQYNVYGAYDLRYSTSYDGVIWSPIKDLKNGFYGMGTGDIDFYLEANGRYLHYAEIYFPASPNQVNYGKLELFPNATMGFVNGTVEQTIVTAKFGAWEVWDSIDIVIDNESRAYVSFEVNNGGGFEDAYILRSDYAMNGTWAVGDWTDTRAQTIFGNLWDEDWDTTLTNNGDEGDANGIGRGVHFICTYDNAAGGGIQESVVSGRNYYNGSGWFNDGMGDSNLADHEGGDWADDLWDVTSIGNMTIIFKQLEFNAGPDEIWLGYGVRIGKRDWTNQIANVSAYELGDAGAVKFHPKVVVDYEGHVLFEWSIIEPDNNTQWFRCGTINRQDGTMTWHNEPTRWESWENGAAWIYTEIGSGMSEPLPPGVPMSMTYTDYVNNWVYHDFLFPHGGELPAAPYSMLNTTLYDANGNPIGEDGTDNWLFEGEVYTLESYIENATDFYINTTDSRHEILFQWDNSTEEQWIEVDPDDQFTIGLVHSEYERTGNITRILWRFIPDRNIIDSLNNTWGYFIQNSDVGTNITASLGFLTHFYNLGGFTTYTFTGDGGRTVGGQPFEIYATNGTDGSSARAEQIYRKLQSVHFLVEIDMDNEWDAGNGEFDIDPGIGFVDIGIDYRLNATWVEGFSVRLYVQSADVGHHNAGNDHDWIEWSIDWYNYDPGTGTQQNFRSGLIYSNHWGYNNENLTPDYYNRTSSQLWIDLWFDRVNASTTVAGQVNAMFHGMREHGSSWWFGYGNFQPMTSDYGNALMLDELYDEGGNVTDSMKFDLMRVFLEVGKVANPADGDDETWLIRAVENMNRKQADDRMMGVEQPAFEETLVLDMPMYQSMNPLIRAIDGISVAIWRGALGFQKILWAAMDSFFEWAGFGEGFFSLITAFIMMIPDVFVAFVEDLGEILTATIPLFESMFRFVASLAPSAIQGLLWLAGSLTEYWNYFQQIMSGSGPFTNVSNLIYDMQLGDWLRAGIAMLPAYELLAISFSNRPFRKARYRIKFYTGLYTGITKFVMGMVDFLRGAISVIMDILPG